MRRRSIFLRAETSEAASVSDGLALLAASWRRLACSMFGFVSMAERAFRRTIDVD